MEEVSLHALFGTWRAVRLAAARTIPFLDLFSIYSGAALDGELQATWTTRYVSAEI